jgi:SAM-dependent methyltransferase
VQCTDFSAQRIQSARDSNSIGMRFSAEQYSGLVCRIASGSAAAALSCRCRDRGAVFDAGRKASIAAAERVGGRILDVGIGTGISLTDYAPTLRIVGVDYCEPMLRRAHERLAEHKLAHVEALAVMDAQHLGFPDAFFDAVVAQYVITTVPDPEAALNELARLTKPGGEIILVNHLGAEAGPRRVFEQSFAPVAPPRLAAGIPLAAAGAMGRAPRRRARARTPPHAALWTLLADSLRAARRGWRRPGRVDMAEVCSVRPTHQPFSGSRRF